MRFLKTYWGILLVPFLAFAYGGHSLWELTTGNYEHVTVIYTYVIAVPMLILAALSILGDLRKSEKSEEEVATAEAATEEDTPSKGGVRRVTLVILASLILVMVLPYVGYLIGFFAYVLFLLWAVELKQPGASLIIALVMAALVHFLFVGLLAQDLPLGILKGVMG